jgi:molybdenum-dependent DNA-binding transcriptional regulator ModE
MPLSAELLSGIYWTELRIFLEVANARSFNKAAQQFNVSHAKIGRAVRRLEEALGTELLATSGPRGSDAHASWRGVRSRLGES